MNNSKLNIKQSYTEQRSLTRRPAPSHGFSWGIGAATLMCIFTVLFLTVFSVLSFMTAQNETENSNKFAHSVSDYYKANEVAVKFYEFTATLAASEKDAYEIADKILSTKFDSVDIMSVYIDNGNAIITAKTSIESETGRNVETIFVINSAGNVTIEKWKSVSLAEEQWVADDSLDLWFPDF